MAVLYLGLIDLDLSSCLAVSPPPPLPPPPLRVFLGAARKSARPEPAFPVVRARTGRRGEDSTAPLRFSEV